MQVEEDEKMLMSREECLNKIAVLCGGRSAEELVFGDFTSGASNDIEQATKLARAMVTALRHERPVRHGPRWRRVQNQYLGGDTSLTCSPETAAKIDAEIQKIIAQQHEKAIEILKANMPKLHELSHYLLDRETITGEEFMRILKDEGLPEKGPAGYRRLRRKPD